MLCTICLELYDVTMLDADDSYLVSVPVDANEIHNQAREMYPGSGFVQMATTGPFCLKPGCQGDLTIPASGWPGNPTHPIKTREVER